MKYDPRLTASREPSVLDAPSLDTEPDTGRSHIARPPAGAGGRSFGGWGPRLG